MKRMTFCADRHRLTEGEVVVLQWQCEGAQQVNLTIDNGYRTSTMPLENEGTKKLRLNRSKGRTKMRLSVMIDGHEYHKTLRIAVRPMPTTRADWVDDRGRKTGFWQRLGQIRHRHNQPRAQLWYRFWHGLSATKRLAFVVLVALMVVSLATRLFPHAMPVGITLIGLGLLWVLWKR
ncbi:MAG: hypothetical protein IJ761_05565 [Bacteroidales bacterium]|nr:hypothetical protein [Bacteroidales bacterium]